MKKYIKAIEILMHDIGSHDFEESVRRYSTAKVISQELALQMAENKDNGYYLQKLALTMTLFREAIFGENEGCDFARDQLESARINLVKVKGAFHE